MGLFPNPPFRPIGLLPIVSMGDMPQEIRAHVKYTKNSNGPNRSHWDYNSGLDPSHKVFQTLNMDPGPASQRQSDQICLNGPKFELNPGLLAALKDSSSMLHPSFYLDLQVWFKDGLH